MSAKQVYRRDWIHRSKSEYLRLSVLAAASLAARLSASHFDGSLCLGWFGEKRGLKKGEVVVVEDGT